MRLKGTIAALLACVAYAMLATWHGVVLGPTMARAATPEAQLEQALATAICHTGSAVQSSEAPASEDPGSPTNPDTECPVCKGLASFQLFLLAAAETGLWAPPAAILEFALRDEDSTHRVWLTPRSRGPPLTV